MWPWNWLDELLGNPWRIRVIRALLREPGRMWTERELAARLQAASPNTINLAVRSLRDAGVLEFRRLGRSNAIRLRQDLRLVGRLQAIFAQETEAWQDIRQSMAYATPVGATCLLFGSAARGEGRVGSDVDVLVVAASQDQADAAAASIRQAVTGTFPLNLSVAALDAKAFRRKKTEPWLRQALKDGQMVSGDPEALA